MIGFLLLVLAQAPVVSTFDDGLIVGRVCEDVDGDGQCSADEPGLVAARVMLETGLTAVTDARGRYHFAAVTARAPDVSQGGRLLPGRHRLGVDPRWLPPGATAPDSVTLELPMGAVAMADFAVRRHAQLASAPTLSAEVPRVAKQGTRVRWGGSLRVAEGRSLKVRGVPAPTLLDLELAEGANLVPFTTTSGDGVLELWALPFDVVARAASWLVVPRPVRALGRVVVDSAGEVRPELVAGADVVVTPGLVTGLVFSTAGQTWSETLERPRPRGVFALGLLDLEASFDPLKSQFHLAGRGAGMMRARLGAFELGAELDLRDADVEAVLAGKGVALTQARGVGVFDRQLELSRVAAPTPGDDSATMASNAAESRLRVELSHDEWGKVGVGAARLSLLDGEVGRASRALQGAFVDLHTPEQATWGAALRGVLAGPQADAVTGLGRRPAHERFEATGGSLFFLGHAPVVQGSERVHVEWRDAVTGLAVRDVPLRRLVDYSVDSLSGRVLLARPVSFLVGQTLQSDPLSAGVGMVLVVDYEYVALDASGLTAGAEVTGRGGPVRVSLAGVKDGAFDLLRARAEATLGPVWVSAEVAHSDGAQAGLRYSRDGGLSFLSRPDVAGTSGWAGTLRARTVGLFGRGSWDLSARFRDSGFEDLGGVGQARQLSLRGEQPLGPIVVSAIVDLRDQPDPRDPFSGARVAGHVFGGGVGYEREAWGVRLEARELSQGTSDLDARGAFSVGVTGRLRVTPWLQLRAGYRQRLIEHGVGFDDTFGMVGADVSATDWLTVGLRAGWGPATGALAWGTLAASRGEETWYGAHSLDVDSPASERRLVTGVRREVSANTAVFVEDVSSTDVNGLRLGRAVGLSQRVGEALTVSARYERGARAFDGVTPDVARDAGGLTLAYDSTRLRAFARGEGRVELGGVQQWLATGGGEVTLADGVSASARVQFSHTSRAGLLQVRALDAVAGFAWRPSFGALLLRYTFHRELQSQLPETTRHVVSVLPTVRLGDRFALGAGAHLALLDGGWLVSASLRPSVRVIAGAELAVEGALRSAAPDGGSLSALRVEAGYRFDHRLYLGAGYGLLGFSGTGLEAGATGSNNRVYARVEVAW